MLADYGFVTMRLSDDWQGADFIALHIDGETVLRVQLKSRLAFQKKYCGKDIWIAFGVGDEWYLYPHDELLEIILRETSIATTESWSKRDGYSFAGLSKISVHFSRTTKSLVASSRSRSDRAGTAYPRFLQAQRGLRNNRFSKS